MNIYELFESMKDHQINIKYDSLNESIKNLDYLYNDNIILENSNNQSKIQKVIAFIREMWKKFTEWIRALSNRFSKKEADIESLLEHDFLKVNAILRNYNCDVKVECPVHCKINDLMMSLNRSYINAKGIMVDYKYADGNEIYNDSVPLEIVKGAKKIEDIEKIIKEQAKITDKHKKVIHLKDCWSVLDPVENLNSIHDFNEKLQQIEKESKDYYDKEIKKIESDPSMLESQIRYFKLCNKVLNESIRVHVEVANKICSIDETIVRKMLAEAERIMKTPEYKKNSKNREDD